MTEKANHTVHFTKSEVEALLDALEIYDHQSPVVPDLEVYYKALEKLQKSLKSDII